jgi:diguanylate cyclase (GGDEF)-like protein
VVILEPNPSTIMTLADNLRLLIEQRPVRHGKVEIPVRASFGVVITLVDSEDGVREAISKADKALYAAKSQGRNRVVNWDQISAQLHEAVAGLAQKN